jgi:hypothetical protein
VGFSGLSPRQAERSGIAEPASLPKRRLAGPGLVVRAVQRIPAPMDNSGLTPADRVSATETASTRSAQDR